MLLNKINLTFTFDPTYINEYFKIITSWLKETLLVKS